jgi:hypothetical protein
MNIAALRRKIRRTGFFIPFRLHFLLLVMALLAAAAWLSRNNALPDTARTSIIDLFITVSFWFAFAILGVSLLTALIPWLMFVSGKKNHKSGLSIKTATNEAADARLQVDISNIIRPPFGYIRLRLLYDCMEASPKFSPIAIKAHTFFSRHARGIYKWPLKNIKEYDINKGIIYFEDFFQFFSLTTVLPSRGNFFNGPASRDTAHVAVLPKKTEDTQVRIEEMRKVEGELVNYKNFESHDDVRRIVWKIYAKNKELVVRIPETTEPYASDVYFYASFYDTMSNDLYQAFNEVFLDQFKTGVWNIYNQLDRQGARLKFIPDQDTTKMYSDDPALLVRYMITTSSWQKKESLLRYFNIVNGSVLCISSLSNAVQVSEIADKGGSGLTIVFVKLSNALAHTAPADWLLWLFVKPAKKSLEKLRINFALSPLRKKMLENEKVIQQVLSKSDCETITI